MQLLQNIPSQNQAVSPTTPDSVTAWFEYVAPDFTQSNVATITGVKKLIEAKKALKKREGSFLQLLEALGQDADKIERLIIIAMHPVLSDSALARNLPLGWTTQFALAKIPPDTLLGFIADGTISPNLTRREAEALAKRARGSNSKNGNGASADLGDARGDAHNDVHSNAHGDAAGNTRGDAHSDADDDGGDDHDGGDNDELQREEVDGTAAAQNAARNDVGENSPSEIERKLARLDELEREAGLWAIKQHGYEAEVQELRAKLDEGTSIRHQRRLFRQAIEAMEKAGAPNTLAKDQRALHNSAVVDLTEFVRSAARNGLRLSRFDIYLRPEVH